MNQPRPKKYLKYPKTKDFVEETDLPYLKSLYPQLTFQVGEIFPMPPKVRLTKWRRWIKRNPYGTTEIILKLRPSLKY